MGKGRRREVEVWPCGLAGEEGRQSLTDVVVGGGGGQWMWWLMVAHQGVTEEEGTAGLARVRGGSGSRLLYTSGRLG
jgi:hypothetical protein